MPETYACSLVLAAHGSLATEAANLPFYELAGQLQQSGVFSAVCPALLNGVPQISDVFEVLPPGDVIVIPLMTSEGYYSQSVFPEQLRANENLDRYRVMVTPAVGTHPVIAHVVSNRIQTLVNVMRMKQEDTVAVVVGHGTTRHPNSGKSTVRLRDSVERFLKKSDCPIDVRIAFIDQSPHMQEVADSLSCKNVIVIPFLISCGPHATDDVPVAFGLPGGTDDGYPRVTTVDGGIRICDLPVGLYPEIADICLEIAADRMAGLQTIVTGGDETH